MIKEAITSKVFFVLLMMCAFASSAFGGKIMRQVDQRVDEPLFANKGAFRTDTAWTAKMGSVFVFDLGEDLEINRVSWSIPKNRYQTMVDYEIYVMTGDGYALQQKIELDQWTRVVARTGNIVRDGRTETFEPSIARYVLIKAGHGIGKSNEVSFAEFSVGFAPLETIGDLEVSVDRDEIHLEWSALEDAVSYRIFRSDASGGRGFILAANAGPIEGNTYVDREVVANKEYIYYVVPMRAGWMGDASNTVHVKTGDFVQQADEWMAGISSLSMGRYGRKSMLDAREDYIENVIGLVVMPGEHENPKLIYPSLKSNRIDELSPVWLHKGIVENVYINEKLSLGYMVPSEAGKTSPVVDGSKANWITRTVDFQYPSGDSFNLYETLSFPGVLLDLGLSDFSLFKNSDIGTPAHYAYASNDDVVVRDGHGGGNIWQDASEPWLLVWWESVVDGLRLDIPMLIVFQRNPTNIEAGEDVIDVSFGDQDGGYLVLMPLYGIEKVDTTTWKDGLPESVLSRVHDWVRYSRSIPLNVEDQFRLDKENDQVDVRYTYTDILEINDDWGTPAESLSVLPSLLGLGSQYEYPVEFSGSIESLDYPAEFGPLYGAKGTWELEFSLPGAGFIVDPGYQRELVDEPVVDRVREMIPKESVDFFLTRPELESWNAWRMRNVPMALMKLLDLYHLYPDKETRSKLQAYSEKYVSAQEFYNTDTYYHYIDQISGKAMNYSLGAEQTNGNPYQSPWIVSTADYFFGEATALYALGKYYDYFDKEDELRAHWETIRYRMDGFILHADWEYQSPAHYTLGRGTGMSDFHNLYLDGFVGYARMADMVGDERAYAMSMYLLARNMLLQYSHWKGQLYAYEYRPYFMNNVLVGEKNEPSENEEIAVLLRLREGYAWFMNENFNAHQSYAYYIFGAQSTHELGLFYDRFLRDEVAKFLYINLPRGRDYDPDIVTHQEFAYRTLLFEDDWEESLNMFKKISSAKDYGLAPNVLSSLFYKNPIRKELPPSDYVSRTFEKDLHEFPPLADYRKLQVASDYELLWEIGIRDNSMREFGIGNEAGRDARDLSNLGLTNQNLSKADKSIVLQQIDFMDQLDEAIFVVGESKPKDFPGLIEASSTSIFRHPELKNHSTNVSFQLEAGEVEAFLLIDLLHVDPKMPTSFIFEVNGVECAISLPMPNYMFWMNASQIPKDVVGMEAREQLLAVPLPIRSLKEGENNLRITVLGGVPAYIDWLAFGVSKQVDN